MKKIIIAIVLFVMSTAFLIWQTSGSVPRSEYDALLSKFKDPQKEIDYYKAEAEYVENENSELQNQLDELQAEYHSLEDKCDSYRCEAEDWKRQYETLKEEFENLSEKVGKIIIPIYDQD